MSKRIVIVGSSFAGLTVALSLRARLAAAHEVLVLSRSDQFVFLPSLLGAPFGLRKRSDLSFPVAPLFQEKGIAFRHEAALALDLDANVVTTQSGAVPYDYLVIATGTKLDFGAVPGLGPENGFTESVFTLEHAEHARLAFERFVRDPGPVVIGSLPGSTCGLASYLLLFEMARQLELHGLSLRAPLTFLTPEAAVTDALVPGVLGGNGRLTDFLLKKLGVRTQLAAAVREITAEEILVEDGRRIPFKYAIVAPPCMGADVVRAADDLVDPRGFVVVDDHYRAPSHPRVYAAGSGVSTEAPGEMPVRGALSLGSGRSEEMAKIVAAEIAMEIGLADGGSGPELPAVEPVTPSALAGLGAHASGLPFGAARGLTSAWW